MFQTDVKINISLWIMIFFVNKLVKHV